MQCEDTAKLRTPLNAVCQTPDIGCVPIVNGKPDCKPQPDEIPIAFDPSTTTLWLFSCKTREWVAFQKFSMCQLSSINLDNIQNICDILQIGVNYNPGTGCRQGTISLRELAEKILECVQLQTKAVSVTANGDKLKIWVEGLEPLPPFYVKGRNLWSEGGTGTEADPLKIATYDPICQWPTKSQAQVDNANAKHIGACLDGQMSRVPFPPKVCELPEKSQAQVNAAANKKMIACINGEGAKVPYPKMPCEFPQMTVEQVNAAADKDMIVCVNGENAKVPIHNQLLTPICDNPQISVAQAKAKPKLRIVSCEDGKIMLFPLPPEMFQGHYMCVPFIDGVPSGPPVEGSGPIRFDCNDDIWFWVCEENRWHRIDVGNHYHQPWSQVYNFIANRCENVKFHGWSEQDDCYTDFEITPKELANFILCECLDPVTPVQANAAIGRGEEVKFPICVNGTAKKIDWSLCSWPYTSPKDLNTAVKANKEVNLGICVDGKNYKTNWNVCSWPDLGDEADPENYDVTSYKALKKLQNEGKELKFAICADGENRKVDIDTVFSRYSGVEIYTASSPSQGFKQGFKYRVDSENIIVRSRDGSIVRGQGVNQGPNIPFGLIHCTVKNSTKFVKLYFVIHGVRLYRTKPYVSQSDVGAYAILTFSPPYCNSNTKVNNEYFSRFTDDGSGPDQPIRSCEESYNNVMADQITYGQLSGHPYLLGTNASDNIWGEQFDISTHPFGWGEHISVANLPKDGNFTARLEPWRDVRTPKGSLVQMVSGINFTSFYVLPGEEVTVSQEAMFTIRGVTPGTTVAFGHSIHFNVIGFPGSIVKNSLIDDDDTLNPDDGDDDD